MVVSEHPGYMAQLGLLNPEIVAWELLPFSFVADWFIPIGSYLEARSITKMVTGLYTTSDKMESKKYPAKSAAFLSQPRASSFDVVYVRSAPGDAPKLPSPVFKPLSQALSVGHVKNAIALLTQVAYGISVKQGRSNT